MTVPVCQRCGRPERILCRIIDGVCQNCDRTMRMRQPQTHERTPRPHGGASPELAQARQSRPNPQSTQGINREANQRLEPGSGVRPRGPHTDVASDWAVELMRHPDDWVVLDTETTGTQNPEVIDVAIIDGYGREIYATLIHAVEESAPVAYRTHRISRTMLHTAPSWSRVLPIMRELLRDRTIIAYNAPFDQRMIALTSHRWGILPLPNAWDCAMQAFRRWRPQERYGLAAACRICGVAMGNHRAGSDARATWRVIQMMAGGSDE